MEYQLVNGFKINVIERGGEFNFKDYHLYKDDLFVASINRVEGELIEFSVLGCCEERAYCKPHEIINHEDRRAVIAFTEYVKDREVVNQKSGWVTKTQFWATYKLVNTNEESKIITD